MPPSKRRGVAAAAPKEPKETAGSAGHSSFNQTAVIGSKPSISRAYTRNLSSAERSLQGGYDGLDWLQPSQPVAQECPLGYICSTFGDQYSCSVVQEKAYTLFAFGGIHDGMYCPANSSNYENCPVGFYCPNSTQKVPCPSGYFCPHKSSRPLIVCTDCGEQSTQVVRANWGRVVFISLVCSIIVVCIVVLWDNWYQKRKSRLKVMEERFITADRESLLKEREREQLERIRPRLEEIAERMNVVIQDQRRMSDRRFGDFELEFMDSLHQLDIPEEGFQEEGYPEEDNRKGVRFADDDDGSMSSGDEEGQVFIQNSLNGGHAKQFLGVDVDGILWFDADTLFDTLDYDKSGDLSYEEINVVMQLSSRELHHFVEIMNELGGIIDSGDHREAVVPRQVFIEHFLEAIEISSNYRASEEDAAKLFDDIARANGIQGSESSRTLKCDASNFFASRVNHFMTEAQINAMIKKIRDKKELGARISPARGRRRGALHNVQITKSEFCEMYPDLLDEVTTQRDVEKGKRESIVGMSGFDIAFSDLCLSVNVGGKSVNVVDQVTGRLQGGTMTALMGGSGAGKTSLLNALCGRASYGDVSGTVRINGNVVSISSHTDYVGFVPQDDIVYPELTVKENLIYSGRFQLRAGTPRREIEDLVDETLANLGLTKVKDSTVGDVNRRGVSGGERKRVHIGIELMRKPSILFLDEPTSGLDASSAMLLVKCLKGLVDTRNITVCSVIHQPRKYIFDNFDSLILLSEGGKLVYEGPTSEAEDYFSKLNYVLPGGEGVADWLIDISSGRLRPVKKDQKARSSLVQSYYQKTPISLSVNKTKSRSTGPTTGTGTIEKSLEKAKIARENLCRAWKEHFAHLPHHQKQQFLPPKKYPLPTRTRRPGFLGQLRLQIRRNFVVMGRNWIAKLIDTIFIVGAAALISALEGTVELTQDDTPMVPYYALESDDPNVLIDFFPALFAYATKASTGLQEYALKVGVITAVLVGLAASRVITDKRLQFNREAASGYDTNAYFLAINVTSTIEHGFQILLCTVCAYWLRSSAAPMYALFFSFFLLSWLSVSWSFLLSILVPAKNTILVIGFFMAFFGLLFSGGLSPVMYSDIYNPDLKALAGFCGLVSPTRYFIEALAVVEHRTLPPQSGFTYIAADASGFPSDETSFDFLSLAQNDSGVVVRSYKGWYWSALPGVIVGLAVRFIAAGFLVWKAKNQASKPLQGEMRKQLAKPCFDQLDFFSNVFFWIFVAVVLCLYTLGLSVWLILRET